MARYKLRNVKTGLEHTVDCPEAQLAERRIGKGPVVRGAKFQRYSKLDGTRIVEELVSVREKSVSTEYAGISHHATWPMKSYSMAIDPESYTEAMKADEELGIKIDYDRETGDAIFDSPGKFKRYCEAHGMVMHNAGYQDPKPRDDREREILGLPQFEAAERGGNGPIFVNE